MHLVQFVEFTQIEHTGLQVVQRRLFTLGKVPLGHEDKQLVPDR